MNKYREQGSAHVVVTACLVVALFFALGWIFWQNFVHKENTKKDTELVVVNKSDENKSVSKTDELVTKGIDPIFKFPLGFTYPKNWQYSHKIDRPEPQNERAYISEDITLTSPSGKTLVTYKIVANSGLGGGCDSTEQGVITSVKEEPVKGLPSANYGEYTLSKKGSLKSDFYAGLLISSNADKRKVGQNACNTFGNGSINLRQSDNLQMVYAEIHFKNVNNVEQFNEVLSGTEYDQAKAILLSMTKKSS